jgi:hypothetical protein
MCGATTPELPAGAHSVLVLSSSGADTCAALAARADRVLLVGYGSLTAEGLRDRLDDRLEDPPPVRSLGVGEAVEAGDLTRQGIAVADSLSAEPAVCVGGFGRLLDRLDREPVFQFVHSLAERCARSSSTMHYHLDPATVDDRAVAALSTLMDAVVRVDEGTVTVQPELSDAE